MFVRFTDNSWTLHPAGVAVQWDDAHFCAPGALTLDDAEQLRVYKVAESAAPAFDAETHHIVEVRPAPVNGVLTRQYEVVPLPAGVVEANAAAREQARIAEIWQAAHDYEFQQISGSAIGLLAMGVMMGKPKCVAVQNWIKSIWALYYTRKATGSSDTDYSSCGAIPHSVPELMVELGV